MDLLAGVRAGQLAVAVEGRVRPARRAHRVPQAGPEMGRGRGAPREGDALHIRERAVRGLLHVPVHGEVRADLAVRTRVGQFQGAPDAAQEGRGDQDRRQIRHQARDRQRQPAALAVADGRDAPPVHLGQRPHRRHRTHRVRDQPPVVVGARVGQAPCRGTRAARCRGVRVGGRAAVAVLVALAAVVHQQMGVSGVHPGQSLVREAAAPAVAGVLDDRGQRLAHPGGSAVPGAYRVAREAPEGDVPGLGQPQSALGRAHRDQHVLLRGFFQGVTPELVEIRGFLDIGTVALQLRRRQVERRHGAPRMSRSK